MSFKKEFDKARKLGKKTFKYKGKLYNTRKEGESKTAWEKALKPAPKKSTKKKPRITDRYLKEPKQELLESDDDFIKREFDFFKRREIAELVEQFNEENDTMFDMTGHKKAGHRDHVHGKSENHVYHGGSDYSMYGGTKKEQDKLIKFMAQNGYRVIDERKAPSRKKGGRGVIHIDANTEFYGEGKETSANVQPLGVSEGEILIEDTKGRYGKHPKLKTQKVQISTPETEERLSALREIARIEALSPDHPMAKKVEDVERLIDPRLQSEQISSVGSPAEMSDDVSSPELLANLRAALEMKEEIEQPATVSEFQEEPEEVPVPMDIPERFRDMKGPLEATYRSDVLGQHQMKNQFADGGISPEDELRKAILMEKAADAGADVAANTPPALPADVQEKIEMDKLKAKLMKEGAAPRPEGRVGIKKPQAPAMEDFEFQQALRREQADISKKAGPIMEKARIQGGDIIPSDIDLEPKGMKSSKLRKLAALKKLGKRLPGAAGVAGAAMGLMSGDANAALGDMIGAEGVGAGSDVIPGRPDTRRDMTEQLSPEEMKQASQFVIDDPEMLRQLRELKTRQAQGMADGGMTSLGGLDQQEEDDSSGDSGQGMQTMQTQGASAPVAGGGSTTGTGAADKSGSGSFTNIQKYVKANQPATQKMSGQVIGSVGKKAESLAGEVEQKVGEQKQKFQDIQQQYDPTQAEGMIQEAMEKPAEFSQEQMDYFSKVREGQYEAPDQLNLGAEENKMKALEELGQNISTSKGRVGVLKENLQRPGYTRGQTSLDEYLFGRDPSVRASNIEAVRGKVADVRKRISGAKGEIKPLSEETQSKISAASENIKKKLQELRGTQNQQTGQYEGGVRGDIQAAQANEQAIQKSITDFMSGASSTLSPEAAARLGAKEGEHIYGISPQDLGSSEIGGFVSDEQAAQLRALGQLSGQQDELADLAQDYEYKSAEDRAVEMSNLSTEAKQAYESEVQGPTQGVGAADQFISSMPYLADQPMGYHYWSNSVSLVEDAIRNGTRPIQHPHAGLRNSVELLYQARMAGYPRDGLQRLSPNQIKGFLNQKKSDTANKYMRSGQAVQIAQPEGQV